VRTRRFLRLHIPRRWAQLLQLEPAKLESEIASMVSDGSVYAKMTIKDILCVKAKSCRTGRQLQTVAFGRNDVASNSQGEHDSAVNVQD
jgi:hypothetical protein